MEWRLPGLRELRIAGEGGGEAGGGPEGAHRGSEVPVDRRVVGGQAGAVVVRCGGGHRTGQWAGGHRNGGMPTDIAQVCGMMSHSEEMELVKLVKLPPICCKDSENPGPWGNKTLGEI